MGAMAGQIAGSVIGGVMANKAAKKQASAQDAAMKMQMQGYTDARPYIQDMYSGGTDALNASLATGTYQGPNYAGINNMQNTGLNNQFGFGNNAYNNANSMMNATGGFADNYANLYNTAGQDRTATATNYANANSRPLVDRAMRDSTRMLEEDTLRNIGMGASATGNTNSSRAGIAEAVAGRDYMDRAADVSAGIRSDLMDKSFREQDASFNNMMNANKGMGASYMGAFGMGNTGVGNMINAGGAFQKDDQNTYDAQKAKFDADRDFAMQQYNSYNAGILCRAPQTSGTVRPNLVDPTAAAMGGAYAGSGMGQKLGNAFGSFFNQSPSVTVAGSNGPNTGFNFGGMGNRSPYLYGDGYGGGD